MRTRNSPPAIETLTVRGSYQLDLYCFNAVVRGRREDGTNLGWHCDHRHKSEKTALVCAERKFVSLGGVIAPEPLTQPEPPQVQPEAPEPVTEAPVAPPTPQGLTRADARALGTAAIKRKGLERSRMLMDMVEGGMSYEQISQHLGVSLSSVPVLVARSRKRLGMPRLRAPRKVMNSSV